MADMWNGEKLELTGTKECSPRVVKYYARWQKQISSISRDVYLLR